MNKDMDWKELSEQPAEGTFEKIQRRLRMRRALRIGLPALAGAAALAVVAIVLPGHEPQVADGTIAAVQVQDVEPSGEQDLAAAGTTVTMMAENKTDEDVNLARLMPTADLQVSPVLPPAGLDSFSVCGPLVWTGDENTPQKVRDIIMQEAVDGIFAASDAVSDSSLPVTHASTPVLPASKSDEPAPEPYHEDNLIWAPNIITPGSDIEENRVFSIKASSELSQFVIHIYNRRGQRIFSSTDQAFKWDATYNGAAVQQGAFVWVASFRDSDGKARTETGTVVVVR